MEATNQPQRTKAFFNFLVFFVITVGMVVLAMLFSFRVPFNEYEQLRTELDNVDKEKIFLATFEMKLQETKKLLDSMNLPGANTESIDGVVNKKIREMSAMLPDAPASQKGLADDVFSSMQDLRKAKMDLYKRNQEASKEEATAKALEQMTKQYQDCKSDYANLLGQKYGNK